MHIQSILIGEEHFASDDFMNGVAASLSRGVSAMLFLGSDAATT
jgi:hypothetical protein